MQRKTIAQVFTGNIGKAATGAMKCGDAVFTKSVALQCGVLETVHIGKQFYFCYRNREFFCNDIGRKTV